MGYQRHEDSEFHPLKSHLENQSYGQTSSLGMLLLSGWQPALKQVFLEKANGNRQIAFPGGFIWSSKASELIQTF